MKKSEKQIFEILSTFIIKAKINLEKMKINTLVITTLLMFLSNSVALGQENKMQKIRILSGEWEIENYVNENNEWKNIGSTKSIIELVYDGTFISEKSKFLTNYGEIHMTTFIGFDSKQGKFKLTAMDKEYGLMDVYLGTWLDNELIFDNLESDLPVKLEDGNEMHFRLSYKEISENSFTHLVEGTTDKGKSWFVFSRSLFKRKS